MLGATETLDGTASNGTSVKSLPLVKFFAGSQVDVAYPYECSTTTTSFPCDVSLVIELLIASKSSTKVLEGSDVVDGSVTGTQLKASADRSEVTLSQTLAVCHDPATRTNVGLRDMMNG